MIKLKSQIPNLKSTIRNLLIWVFVALIAIGLVESNALLGLSIAALGGILLGIALFVK